MGDAPRVTLIGAGMITHDQILPSLYHLQRTGRIGEIHICGTRAASLRALRDDETLRRAFPGQGFTAYPDPDGDGPPEPERYLQTLADAPRHAIAVIAVPDQLHLPIAMEALRNDQHLCVVKPLALTCRDGETIAEEARRRGLLVGIEYHKRFDHRALMARSAYRAGKFGNFRLAQAQLHEPYYYRDSNFQNWCTCEHTDMFTYVGCHYVDQIAFITGLRPVSVSVYGIRDRYPNGNEGFLWTDARVVWENGGCLSVVNAIGSPNAAAGANFQGLVMWGQGDRDATMLRHSDQFRGVTHSCTEAGDGPGDTVYSEPNPDYMRLLDMGGDGLTPVGYGYRSIAHIVEACIRAGAITDLAERTAFLDRLDAEGIVATPRNSSYNELVIEAGRMSILAGGREVAIAYEPAASVAFREYA